MLFRIHLDNSVNPSDIYRVSKKGDVFICDIDLISILALVLIKTYFTLHKELLQSQDAHHEYVVFMQYYKIGIFCYDQQQILWC